MAFMNEINFKINDIQEIKMSMDVGIKEIYPPIEDLEVTPTKEQQIFNHEDSYGYDKVTVEAIPDEYIIPEGTLPITENATYDVTTYARVSTSVHPAPNLQDKEVNPTKEIQTITSDDGYDGLNQVTVNSIPDEYVIPKLDTKTITSSGTYNASDDNLDGYSSVEVNISGGDPEIEASYKSSIDNSLGSKCTKLPSDLTSIGAFRFYACLNLALTELPSTVTSIGRYSFYNCNKLALNKLPDNLTSIGDYAFWQCFNLAITEIPVNVTQLPVQSFYSCGSLTKITCLGNITSIGAAVFSGCSKLEKFALPNVTSVPSGTTSMFNNTPIARGTGYIYVPDNLVDSFKSATGWSTYANQIKGISEYTG